MVHTYASALFVRVCAFRCPQLCAGLGGAVRRDSSGAGGLPWCFAGEPSKPGRPPRAARLPIRSFRLAIRGDRFALSRFRLGFGLVRLDPSSIEVDPARGRGPPIPGAATAETGLAPCCEKRRFFRAAGRSNSESTTLSICRLRVIIGPCLLL